MNGNFVLEHVDYPDDACGGVNKYCFPSPPYREYAPTIEWVVDDPYTAEMEIGSDILTPSLPFFVDKHKVPTVPGDDDDQLIGFSGTRAENVFIATQYYRFRDPVMNETITLDGPHYIRRNVYQDGDVWKYRIEKDGESAVLVLP
jgi:hypothetical protein